MTNESTLSDLRAAISRLEAEKRQIEERHRALVTTLRYFENAESSEGRPEQEPQHRRADNDLRNAMAAILASEGPLHRRVIHDRLVEMGVHIGGRDPVANVGAPLSRDPRFRKLGDGVWDLTDRTETSQLDTLDYSGEEDLNEEDSVAW